MDAERLKDTLGRPEMEWLLQRLRRRLENGVGLTGTVTLQTPTPAERSAMARLFGRRHSSPSLVVKLHELDRLLRDGEICDGLQAALDALLGSVPNLKHHRTAKTEEWQRVFAEAPAGAWLDELRATGLLKRIAKGDPRRARQLLRDALRVIERLPARGVPIAQLAATSTGNSHALDPGEPVGTLVIRYLSLANSSERLEGAEERRHAWASAGVLCDELSSPVLVLNLVSDSPTPTGEALRLHSRTGEPYRLSIRQLLRDQSLFRSDRRLSRIFVCENPTIVAAAANRLGIRCAPLICIEGQPKTASRLLLDQMEAGGCKLLYHGDFDWPGIQIANLLYRRHGFIPWRFTASDYRSLTGSLPLTGNPTDALWDPELKISMITSGRTIHEEQLIDTLLADLSSAPSAPLIVSVVEVI